MGLSLRDNFTVNNGGHAAASIAECRDAAVKQLMTQLTAVKFFMIRTSDQEEFH